MRNCPMCNSELEKEDDECYCPQCGIIFPYYDDNCLHCDKPLCLKLEDEGHTWHHIAKEGEAFPVCHECYEKHYR